MRNIHRYSLDSMAKCCFNHASYAKWQTPYIDFNANLNTDFTIITSL